jgi:hypothetical protein
MHVVEQANGLPQQKLKVNSRYWYSKDGVHSCVISWMITYILSILDSPPSQKFCNISYWRPISLSAKEKHFSICSDSQANLKALQAVKMSPLV